MISTITAILPPLVSFITVCILYNRLQPKWLRLFSIYLLITILVEVVSSYYSLQFKKSNHFILNLYLPVNFGFYFYLFYKSVETKNLKRLISAGTLIYFLFSLCDILFIEGLFYFNIYSFCLGSILIVVCCLLYFMRLFMSDTLINFFTTPMFWISTGLLFFYVGNLLQTSLMRYIIENDLDPGGSIYKFIMITLNIILYGAITAGFVCNRPWIKEK